MTRGVVVMMVMTALAGCGVHKPPPPQPVCVGDCDGNGRVDVWDIVRIVNIQQGQQPITACPNGDPNHDGQITVDEFQQALTNTTVCK